MDKKVNFAADEENLQKINEIMQILELLDT